MPASLTSRTVAPPSISSTSAGTRDASFASYRLTTLPAGLTSSAWARVRIRRVSSAAITSALPRALTSRAEASDGWPSGVAPMSSRPVAHAGQPTIAVVTAPADELVAKGRAVPVISPAPLVPVADFGPVDRLQGWAMTAVITALAAVTRFLNLGSPTDAGTPIFDEKHYAPQAWQLLHNHGVEDNPGYGLVVHPPVGKQLIAIGEALFGYNGLGWRFSGAVCGVILVLLVVRIGRRISRSTLVGGIAGLLLIADGVSFVAARTALLDGFLTLFVVAAFGCLIVDRDQVRERMHVALLEGRIGETPWGPRLGVRWWRFGAGVLLGLACATKWSGLYFIVFFGLMTLAFDIAARRQYRVPRPWLGAFRRDLGPSLYALVLIPFGVYLASYAPWFASETGGEPPRGRPVDRPGQRAAHSRRGALAVALHVRGVQVPRRADERRRQPPPVGVQAVDVADVAAAGAVRDRQPERAGLRRAVVREGRDAGRHAGDVVHRGAGAGVGGVAGVRQAGLALRGDPGRLRRGLPAVVRRHRPADVLLLRGDDGAVPGADDRDDSAATSCTNPTRTPSEERSG